MKKKIIQPRLFHSAMMVLIMVGMCFVLTPSRALPCDTTDIIISGRTLWSDISPTPTNWDSICIEWGSLVVDVDNGVCGYITVQLIGTLFFDDSNPNIIPHIQVASGVTVVADEYNGIAGTIDMSRGGVLTTGFLFVDGSVPWANWSSYWIPGSGTVELTSDNTLPDTLITTFNNLTISAFTTTLEADLTVTDTLEVKSGATFKGTGTGTITIDGSLINDGTFSIDGNGGECRATDPHILITSTSTGVWSGDGSYQLFNVTVDHQDASDYASYGSIAAIGSTDGNNNTNFDFSWTCEQFYENSPTAVALKSFTATDYDGKVLLQWRTGEEVSNLGFHAYREEAGRFTRLTPGPVAGSALVAGRNINLRAGRSYSWWDDSLQGIQPQAVRYWVEDIDISGKRSGYGPVTAVPSRGPIPPVEEAALLSRLTHTQAQTLRRLQPRLTNADIGVLQPMKAGAAKTPQEMQWALAGATAVKLFVQEEGWYRVTQPGLAAFGLEKADPRRFQLYAGGQEVPMVIRGQNDGHFDSGDSIEFYGTGLDTSSTDTRTYWLVVGSKQGKRISRATGGGGSKGKESGSSFPFTVESKPRMLYFSALSNGEGNNKFFGPLISTEGADPTVLKLNVTHPDPSPTAKAKIQVSLQGVTEGQHTVQVTLNDQPLGQVTFSGQSQGTLSLDLSQGMFVEGENQVKLVATGGEMDMSLVDTVRLTYYHSFMADDNALKFSASGAAKLTIGGFSSAMIWVMDITDPLKVTEVSGQIKSQGSSYQISITVPGTVSGSGTRTLMAFSEERIKEVSGITPNTPSSWNSKTNGADMVIITNDELAGSLGPLKSFRESQGYSVAMVDVEDLYDEFSFGNKSPQAMKDFLARASTMWKKAPRFVLLAGDGSADPRNYLGYSEFDLVPTHMVQAKYNETVSDDWLVDFNGDGLPDMAIGRIPVRTPGEASAVVSKIVGYEQYSGNGQTKSVLLVADATDINDKFDFEGASKQVAGLLPVGINVSTIYRGHYSSDQDARTALLNGIAQGALLVNYLGHGSDVSWRGDLITTDDVATLNNGRSLPFFINMTCWNGWFADPYGETLGESLLKAGNGGAVAVWASSGMTEPEGQVAMDKQLMQLLFSGQSLTIGEAVAKAKAAVTDMDVRRTWILLGDPTTRLK